MTHQTLIEAHPGLFGLAGITLLLLGGLLRYRAGRARFYRRNPYGVMLFRTYSDAALFQPFNRAAEAIGTLMFCAGFMLTLAAMLGSGH